ncbi:MAG TPA: CYTH domain-containing protein [Bacteroidales bacterium]|nr:CYTH domain-containing protein [Bacteroidales bacterium]
MATETERKYLVKGDFRKYVVKEINITQGYLSIDPMKTIRIRITDQEGYITVKSPRKEGLLARGEWEFSIPVEDARELMDICLPGRVIKTRHIIPWGEYKFEVDVFHDKNEGLTVAEIELESEDDIFEKPDWLGEEVTGDPRYYSSMLIK